MKQLALLMMIGTMGLTFGSHAFGRVVLYGGMPEIVYLKPVGASILKFTQEVKTVSRAKAFQIVPVDPADPNYKILSITPRVPGARSDVTFMLVDGSVVRLKLVVASSDEGAKADSVYELKPKSQALSRSESDSEAQTSSALELMKAMLRGDQVAGFSVMEHSVSMSPSIFDGHKGLKAELTKEYLGKEINGYVYRVVNLTNDKPMKIDIRYLRYGSPNLAILSQVDHALLKGRKSKENVSYLRVVTRGAASRSDFIVHIGEVDHNEHPE